MEPIELTTGDGLLLRAWQRGDVDAVHRACQDPLIQRWTTVPSPYAREDADFFVNRLAPDGWTTGTGASLGVFDARTGEMLGASGLAHLDTAVGTGEIGVWVAPQARGRRVAERAGRAVAHWALDVLRLDRLLWRAEIGNHVSRLAAERIGFTFDGVARAEIRGRDGSYADAWRGVLLPGEITDPPPAWVAPGGPGARRVATFAGPPERLPAGPVTLRHPREHDLDDMVATCRDPESVRWTTVPVDYRRADAISFLRSRFPGGWLRGTAAGFAVADPDDRFAGSIELRMDPGDRTAAELGFLIAPWARGRGYATEAVRALCAFGFERLALDRIVWRAHVGNEASRRVAEKVGFRMEGTLRGGCEQRGERHDGWIAGLLRGDL